MQVIKRDVGPVGQTSILVDSTPDGGLIRGRQMLAVRGNVPQNGGLNHLAVDGDFRGVGRRKRETQ
jgi:hypothetical protein